jgi:very-short-patch-repair endonuclease
LSRSQLGGFTFRRQATIGRLIVDFFCPSVRLVVEVDGDTHADPVADAARDAVLRSQGLTVVRVSNADVMHNIDGVLRHLFEIAQSLPLRRAPHPNPTPEREGL